MSDDRQQKLSQKERIERVRSDLRELGVPCGLMVHPVIGTTLTIAMEHQDPHNAMRITWAKQPTVGETVDMRIVVFREWSVALTQEEARRRNDLY